MKETDEGLRDFLRSYLGPDDEHPDLEEALFRYADGTLHRDARAEVDEHLEQCERCRQDVADAVALQRGIDRRRPVISWLIAAAAAAAIVAAALWLPRERPRTIGPSAAVPPEWSALVQQARARRRIDPPLAFRALQVGPDILRDHVTPRPGGTFSPTATVIETPQPEFRWPTVKASTYVVRVFQDVKEIARSPLLRQNRWTPPQPLVRGVTYVWQVEAHSRNVTILPAPPDPPNLFTVLGTSQAAEIAEARRRFAGDHLLLGVLYARAGVREGAKDELIRWTSMHPTDTAARELLASVEAW